MGGRKGTRPCPEKDNDLLEDAARALCLNYGCPGRMKVAPDWPLYGDRSSPTGWWNSHWRCGGTQNQGRRKESREGEVGIWGVAGTSAGTEDGAGAGVSSGLCSSWEV